MSDRTHINRLYRYASSDKSTRADHLAEAAAHIEKLEAELRTLHEYKDSECRLRKENARLRELLVEARYLVGAFERGCEPLDYGRDIYAFWESLKVSGDAAGGG